MVESIIRDYALPFYLQIHHSRLQVVDITARDLPLTDGIEADATDVGRGAIGALGQLLIAPILSRRLSAPSACVDGSHMQVSEEQYLSASPRLTDLSVAAAIARRDIAKICRGRRGGNLRRIGGGDGGTSDGGGGSGSSGSGSGGSRSGGGGMRGGSSDVAFIGSIVVG